MFTRVQHETNCHLRVPEPFENTGQVYMYVYVYLGVRCVVGRTGGFSVGYGTFVSLSLDFTSYLISYDWSDVRGGGLKIHQFSTEPSPEDKLITLSRKHIATHSPDVKKTFFSLFLDGSQLFVKIYVGLIPLKTFRRLRVVSRPKIR